MNSTYLSINNLAKRFDRLSVIEDFFSGKTDELADKDRERIEALLLKEAKKG